LKNSFDPKRYIEKQTRVQMLNLRKRIKELQESTSSIEAKSICKEVLENFVNIPESQISDAISEKLKTVEDGDKHVEKFLRVTEKITAINDLGVSKGIATIKESGISSYPALTYTLSKIENSLINFQSPEFMVIDSMIESIKPFIWDNAVNTVFSSLVEKRKELNEDIEVAKSVYSLSKAKGSFMYEGIVNKLKDHFVNPTESSRSSILEDLKKFSFSSEIKSLAESFNRIQREKKGGVQIISENSKSSIHSAYSPVLLENGKEYFYVRGNFFSKSEGKIEKITEESISSLPEKFREVCRIISSPNVFVKEGKISFYVKRNKVEIFENEKNVEVHFNGKKVTSTELAKNMVSAGLFRLEESKIAYDVQSIAESFENIFDLDFAKVVESNVHKGSFVILMKDGDNIYLNKVNESMKSNEFFSGLNATQARNIVMEFINFDIKESLEEYLEKDEVKLKELREAQVELLKNISIVEANIEKVKVALQDNFMSNSPELSSLKDLLESEMSKLRNDHRSISQQIKAFENKTSDAGLEVGDEVKLESGDSATVTSINSSRDTVTVVTAGGKTQEVPITKVSSMESEISRAEAKNANESEETEEEKKKL